MRYFFGAVFMLKIRVLKCKIVAQLIISTQSSISFRFFFLFYVKLYIINDASGPYASFLKGQGREPRAP